MKKFWIILLSLAAAAALFCLIWSGSGYLLSEKEKLPAELPEEVNFLRSEDPRIGAVVEFQGRFKLPRYRKILRISTEPGKGTVLSQQAAARKERSSWKYDSYLLEGAICALRPGESRTGTITVEISPAEKNGSPEKFTVRIPACKILALPVPASPEPELAESVPLPQKEFNKRHLLWLLLLLLIPILWFFLKKRKKQSEPLSLKCRTLNALDALRAEVFSRRLSAREGIAGVSDLIRNYLEERFSLPVSKKTTPEFLEDLEFNIAIPEQACAFLRNFLNAADMIKFAQAPCDSAAVNTAVQSAVELVEKTSLPEKEEK